LSTDPTEKEFNDAVALMKLSTRQYAKRQILWMRNKLLPAAISANAKEPLVSVYLLDATSEFNFLNY
jgi:tRNA dimethylallyltransferase